MELDIQEVLSKYCICYCDSPGGGPPGTMGRRPAPKPAPAFPPHDGPCHEAGLRSAPSNQRLKTFMQTVPLATLAPSRTSRLLAPSTPAPRENSGQDPRDIPPTPQLQERGLQQGGAVMRWKIWANPEPNEGLIRAVKICQLLVNSSSAPSWGEGAASACRSLWAYT